MQAYQLTDSENNEWREPCARKLHALGDCDPASAGLPARRISQRSGDPAMRRAAHRGGKVYKSFEELHRRPPASQIFISTFQKNGLSNPHLTTRGLSHGILALRHGSTSEGDESNPLHPNYLRRRSR